MKTRALIAFALSVSFAAPALAQDYQPFRLGAGFLPDPQIGTGFIGGAFDASAYQGCNGFVAERPDHQLHITSPVDLTMYVQSQADSTLLVVNRQARMHWCNDDTNGLNPQISAVFQPGYYEVYVGQFNPNSGARYQLTLTENLGGQAPRQPNYDTGGIYIDQSLPAYADFRLGRGFTPDPQRSRGTTGGSRRASEYGAQCSGMISSEPDHELTVTSAVDLRVFVDSQVDATLVIAGPEGRLWCDDDSNGNLDPAVSGHFPRGHYRIFVGNFGERSGEYQISITEQ